jgi:hypothetical protein
MATGENLRERSPVDRPLEAHFPMLGVGGGELDHPAAAGAGAREALG